MPDGVSGNSARLMTVDNEKETLMSFVRHFRSETETALDAIWLALANADWPDPAALLNWLFDDFSLNGIAQAAILGIAGYFVRAIWERVSGSHSERERDLRRRQDELDRREMELKNSYAAISKQMHEHDLTLARVARAEARLQEHRSRLRECQPTADSDVIIDLTADVGAGALKLSDNYARVMEENTWLKRHLEFSRKEAHDLYELLRASRQQRPA